jgi:hypothetical protein
MAAGCGPFFWANVPADVRAGGICLSAIALILADVQNDKKLGYTNAILKAVRKIPGMEQADEGTVMGALTCATVGFLGVPVTVEMAKHGATVAGVLTNAENYISFPLGAAFGFQRTRRKLESMLGKEMRFSYRDADGKSCLTEAISTSRLLQQLAFLSGAAGITGMGAALGSEGIIFTGVMFGLSHVLNIQRLTAAPVSEVMAAEAKCFAAKMQAALGDVEPKNARKHMEALQQPWQAAQKVWVKGDRVKTEDMKAMGQRLVAALSGVVGEYVQRPSVIAERKL